jgi:predicted phage terminase large subunit-like protein
MHEGRYFILDIRRMRGTPYEVERMVSQTADMDGISVPIVMEQEPGSSGVNVIDHYSRQVVPGYNFRGQKSTTSKKDRAAVFSAACEAGNVHIARESWNASLIDECEVFPYGAHDDQVDAISGAILSLAGKGKKPVRVLV